MRNIVDNTKYIHRYKEYLDTLHPIPNEDWKFYSSLIEVKRIKKGDLFIKEGGQGDQFGFVIEGLFKQYFNTQDGKQYILSFIEEDKMISDFVSLIKRAPARTNIMAIEDSIICCIAKPKARYEMSLNITWERIGRFLAENRFVEKENKEWDFLHLEAKDRYLNFCRDKSNLLERLTQSDIASYLGISNVSLSRIRSSLK